ncbi:hypothetical protein PY365_30525 [Roseiarcaceae bacterium H3SJ34-1]|uniref:hypothetical protein n=1 Tax=Terripilifer ovatus TaxID=3032367 RepID=UPI003AB94A42|nr:hypothetical protein [Roseiarcaceae bacterium H3SJ34-1]
MRFLTLRWIWLGMAMFGIAAAASAQPVDRIGVPGPLDFDGKAYALAWSSNPSSGYFKQEYLTAGQDTATYTQMIMIDVLETGVDVKTALASQVRFLNQRKATDPMVNMAIVENKATGEVLLDFIISDDSTKGKSIAEWNAYRYKPHTARDGRKGVILFALSRRAYNDGIDGFLRELRSLRPGLIGKVARYTLPAVATSSRP